MIVEVNGVRRELADGATVDALLRELEIEREPRGIAVAVDGDVVPRSAWTSYRVRDGARVEILTAIQGG